MNAIFHGIGVDYQPSRCVVALREGIGVPPRTRSVGDGVRQMIPNPVGATGNPDAERVFWRELAARLYRFLGRVRPTAENGYEVVVATAGDADSLSSDARAAGLSDVACISPTDALVSRWLVETAGQTAERGLVVAVAIGDATTLVAGYEVSDDARGLPRVSRGDRREQASGYDVWVPIFAERVRERLTEVGDVTHDPTLFDSVVEYGAKLRAAPRGKTVEWQGPWPERLYEPVRVTREECEAWEAVRNWMNRVGGLVGDFALSGGSHAIDQILVGGIGAVWPFAADAVARWGPVWQSGAPWLDLAAGAAWWPETDDCFAASSKLSPRAVAAQRVQALETESSRTVSPPFVADAQRQSQYAALLGTPEETPPPTDLLGATRDSDDPPSFIPDDTPGDSLAPETDESADLPSPDDLPPWERNE